MPQIILASKSPRRQELLKHIVPEFEIRTKETEEVYPNNMAAKDVPVYLAQLKAKAFIASMKDEAGKAQTERQDVADVFAEFYEALYKHDGPSTGDEI